jgi:hypothetical protein
MRRTLPCFFAPFLVLCAVAAGAGSLLLPGCGGGSPNAATAPAAATTLTAAGGQGTLEVLIKWPPVPEPTSRLIPAAAKSILLVVTDANGRHLGEQRSRRPFTGQNQTPPTDTAFFPDLPAGPVRVTASAFPNEDATGIPQATGSLTASVVANQKTRTPPLTMGTTIVKVQIDVPMSPSRRARAPKSP